MSMEEDLPIGEEKKKKKLFTFILGHGQNMIFFLYSSENSDEMMSQ